MKKLTVAIATVLTFLVASSSTASADSGSTNEYWNSVVRSHPYTSWIVGKEEIIGLGWDTCHARASGASLSDLANLLRQFDADTQVLVATSMAAAMTYLCEEKNV